jgi:hypothetical protein
MAAVKYIDLQGTLGIWGFVNLNCKEVIISDDYCREENFKNVIATVLNCAINKWIKINKKGEITNQNRYENEKNHSCIAVRYDFNVFKCPNSRQFFNSWYLAIKKY